MRYFVRGSAAALALSALTASAYWHNLLTDDFSAATPWVYAGATNASAQPLFRLNTSAGVVEAEWDQSNAFNGGTDPYTIVPSRLARDLPRVLTDRDTFRFGATLRIEPGSVSDTSEFHQIANFGLYNLAFMGDDRSMADNYSFAMGWVSQAVKDGSDFVEFNYWIGNDPDSMWGAYYRSAEATVGAHIEGLEGDYNFAWTTGSDPLKHDTQMLGGWLPEDTNLYIELVYHGAATGAVARRVYMAVYTEPERTNILTVNGVAMYYWTPPQPADKTFTLAQFAFQNYVSPNYGDSNAVGRGTFDNVYVDLHVAEGAFFAQQSSPGQHAVSVGAVSGAVYRIETCTDLFAGNWTLHSEIAADGDTLTFTNQPDGGARYYRVAQ